MNDQITICILDDDPFIGKMLTSMLAGYKVVYASSFADFKKIIEQSPPDIAIIDLYLPDAHGLDVCKWIRNQDKYEDIILYVLTATDDEQTLIRAYSIGVMDYIIKPFNKFILFSKLRRCAIMIEIKRKLERSLEYQKSIKHRLFRLNEFISKCIAIDDMDTLVSLMVYIHNIISVEAILIASPKKDGTFSFVQLHAHSIIQKVFPKIKQIAHQETHSKVIYFSIATQNVYGARLSLQKYGYIFLLKQSPFSSDEKNLISLLAEILHVIINRNEVSKYVQKQNKLYLDEVSKVRQIQVAQLPKFRNVKSYSISSTFLPAEDISGDFFDGFHINDRDVYQVVLCDVSGHGIASSYIGNALRTLIRTYSRYEDSPAKVLERVNKQMSVDGKGLFYFATTVICRLYPDGTIVFASGGHPPLLCYRKHDHTIEEYENTGGLIGIFEDMTYYDNTIVLKPGDMLFMYTDGLTESINAYTRELFGENRLKEQILAYAGENPVELLHSICGSMYEFTNYAPLDDDITLICITKQ